MKVNDLPETIYSSEHIRLKQDGDTHYIFDSIRNKWLVLTPEEWVRQHVLLHFVHHLNYPISAIAVEKVIELNGMPKRFDALVYVHSKPAILIECKAPKVQLTEEVFHQACRYNREIQAPITVLTNGLKTIIAHVDLPSGKVQFSPSIPHRSDWN